MMRPLVSTVSPGVAAPWPRPGLRWGLSPQRPDHQAAWHATPWQRLRLAFGRQTLGLAAAAAVRARQQHWLASWPSAEGSAAAPPAALRSLRQQLIRRGRHDHGLRDDVLGCVAAAALRALGRDPFDTQLACAQALWDERLVEMATGEGKTLAVALAAAAWALSGMPVHVMTANDYLAERDAQLAQPLLQALGLRLGVVTAATAREARAAAYAADITYGTAREMVFDHLRDGLAGARATGDLMHRAAALAGQPGTAPLQRGLCAAIVDEADSVLIDEAVMPLVLSEGFDDAQQRAACFQALALARTLELGADALLEVGTAAVHWTAGGLQRLEQAAQGLGGAWLNRRHREDLAAQALVALHGLQPGRDYLVDGERIELLDRLSGRRAPGRVWSRALQTLVELKEGVKPSAATRTAAQTSYQRFFARYHCLAGTSGTLRECRHELAAIYGRAVQRLAPRRPRRHTVWPDRRFATADERRAAVAARVAELIAQGRAVLVGVADVTEATRCAAALQAAGIAHRVLDASHDAQEAEIVARAGQAGAVTVATAMAGRGTDIELGAGVAARGGLHVLDLMDSPCARTVRQLHGRAARQGEPGSAETWTCAELPPLDRRRHARHERHRRRELLEQDLLWHRRLASISRHA